MANKILVGGPGWFWRKDAPRGEKRGFFCADRENNGYIYVLVKDPKDDNWPFMAFCPAEIVTNDDYYDHTGTNCNGDKL